MFIELTLFMSDIKIAININNVTDFVELEDSTELYVIGQETPLRVDDSYEVVVEKIRSI